LLSCNAFRTSPFAAWNSRACFQKSGTVCKPLLVSDEEASHEREVCEFSRYAGAAALMLAIADAGEKIAWWRTQVSEAPQCGL
jgi:hypothetical protein